MRRLLALVVILSIGGARSAPARAPADPQIRPGPGPRIDRLVALAKVWGNVRWLHPYLFDREIAWDEALVAAIPKVEDARSADQFAAAVGEMLGALHDPLTHMVRDQAVGTAAGGGATGDPAPLFEERAGGLLVVPLQTIARAKDSESLRKKLLAARSVIFDLRAASEAAVQPSAELLQLVQDALPTRECAGPTVRRIEHSGFRPQAGGSSGGYSSSFVTDLPETFSPPTGGTPKRVAFLLNKLSPILPIMLALQNAGDGVLVAQGPIGEENLSENQTALPLGEGWHVAMRTVELADGYTLRMDAQLPAASTTSTGTADPAMKSALTHLQKPSHPPRGKAAAPAQLAVWRSDRAYPEMKYPVRTYRLLALFRVWAVIHFFYPYQHLMDRNWDDVLAELIPKIENASDAKGYALCLAELSTRVPDGHTSVLGSDELKKWFGEARPPVQLRMIENQPVIIGLDDPAVAEAGIAVGDIVTRVDGEAMDARLKRYGAHLAASNSWQHGWRSVDRVLGGNLGQTCVLTLRDRAGKEKDVKLIRDTPKWGPFRKGEVVRILPGNVGYVDLERLTVEEVGAMFKKLGGTRAIIFDMRGYPKGTAWAIAPRINTRNAKHFASFQRPIVSPAGVAPNARYSFLQELPPYPGPKYAGRTVMLIDERTISQAEHTGLFFEAAAGTKFVGSPTAGANGDVTALVLPGGVRFMFTGHDVRHADGRQLQRIGLVPDVTVTPTIAGIRAGKDEVLERALEYLSH
jgi:C-terminal processing protease CtpA/Prc